MDTLAWFCCFSVSLFAGVEVGLLFGIFISVVGLLRTWVRPEIAQNSIERAGTRYVKLSPETGLFFPAVDFLRTKVIQVATEQQVPVVVDCSTVIGLDHTSAKGLKMLADELGKIKQQLVLLNLKPGLRKLLTDGAKAAEGTITFWEDEAAASVVAPASTALGFLPGPPHRAW
uniref:Sodium-independent sulfate anion transporter n=2 Tax=Culex pipiens TaxID=7175 RepID=A0A8D8HHA0_CULPI